MTDRDKRPNRIVVETASARPRRTGQPTRRQPGPGRREGVVALTVIAAAALATFVALFLTIRPYDPMNSTVPPLQTVPEGSVEMQSSPRPSSSGSPSAQQKQAAAEKSPEPSGDTAIVSDDAGIQSQIERTLASDPILSKLDVSTLVDRGRVTIVGAVRSADLKQQVERAIRPVKGVVGVDNQLVVAEATP